MALTKSRDFGSTMGIERRSRARASFTGMVARANSESEEMNDSATITGHLLQGLAPAFTRVDATYAYTRVLGTRKSTTDHERINTCTFSSDLPRS